MDIELADQQLLFKNLANETVKTAVWEAWRRLPEADRAFLRLCNLVVHDDLAERPKNGGFAVTLPIDGEPKTRHIWLNPTLPGADLVNAAGHEFAHHVLRHPDFKHGRNGAWYLEEFLEMQTKWLACEHWSFEHVWAPE